MSPPDALLLCARNDGVDGAVFPPQILLGRPLDQLRCDREDGRLDLIDAARIAVSCLRSGDQRLYFGPGYDWVGVVRRYEPPLVVAWELTDADPDWRGTRVGFTLIATPYGHGGGVLSCGLAGADPSLPDLEFLLGDGISAISSATMETGEVVEYERRLEV